jgi:hypothetical protein
MQSYYRNKWTSEIKLVEQDSPEMFQLQREVGPDGYSKWEQTSPADVDATAERARLGELDPTDLGKEHDDVLRTTSTALDISNVAAEQAPWLNLTPGEIEAGLTPSQKQEDLKAMFAQDSETSLATVFEDAAEKISKSAPGEDKRQSKATSQAKGLRARAGGSDEREDVPRAKAKDDSKKSSGSSGGGPGAGQAPRTGDNPTAAQ